MSICSKCNEERKWVTVSESHKKMMCGCHRKLSKRPSFVNLRERPVAYYKHEKSGKMIPVNKKGNVISNDPYYSKQDPRGWKQAGHKDTRGYQRSLHLDEGAGKVIHVREH